MENNYNNCQDGDDNKQVSLTYLDVLKEIGTISSGRLATALSDLLNCKVEIALPETKLVPIESLASVLGNPEEAYFVLDLSVEGDINGRVFFLLSPEEAKIMGSALLGKDLGEADLEDMLFQSSLEEMVNIVAGAYMNALSDMTGLTIMYNPPSLAIDMVGAILDFFFIHVAQYSDEAILIKTELKVQDIHFNGVFLFFPDLDSVKKLFKALGLENN